jgi:hypothetical protein
MHRPTLSVLFACVVSLSMGVAAAAEQAPDPAAYRKGLLGNGRLMESTGEAFAWNFAFGASDFVEGYEAFHDPAWLAVAEEHFDWAIDRGVSKDPDGFPGTFGGSFDKNKVGESPILHDTLVGDALVVEPMLAWAEIVLADAELTKRFGEKAKSYVALAHSMCFEKVNHRDCYYLDRRGFGSFHTYPKGIDAKTREWVNDGGMISDNLNKHYTNGHALLRLWRITGEDALRERVVQVYSRHKAMRRYYPDEQRVVWNFWMPHGPYDIKANSPESWVSVHPSRAGYQAGETSDIVEVYDSGLVFERKDLELMIATNVWMKDQGWKSADGATKAGTLWGALARFDARLGAEMDKRNTGKDATAVIHRANWNALKEQTAADPWARRYLKPGQKVEVSDLPLEPGKHLSMAMVIPDTVHYRADERVRLATKVEGAGMLKLELLSADGKENLGTIVEREMKAEDQFFSPLWDGKVPKSGEFGKGRYTVRWTFMGEQREWPVWIEAGDAAVASNEPAALAAGEKLSVDFEAALDARWQLTDKAAVDGTTVHGGAKSLAVRGGSVEYKVGRFDDLPLRVSAWLYDGGVKRGQSGGEGPGIGVKLASGDVFAVRQAWRKYLNGDVNYAWFNTGENRWFTPHPTNLTRSTGWQHWVIDMTADATVITCDGNELEAKRLSPPQFVPGGAVSVVFFGGVGENPAGTLFVDDLEVSRP